MTTTASNPTTPAAPHAAGVSGVTTAPGWGPLPAGRVAVSYERVTDPKDDPAAVWQERGVGRQAKDADAVAEYRNLGDVVHLRGDEGISASRFATKQREDWPRLLEMLRAGSVGVVLVSNLDRVIRQTRDNDDLLDACRDYGAFIIQTSTGSVINPNDPDSVAFAKYAAVRAEQETAIMSMRQRRKHRAIAEKGGFHGGRRRFGYTADMSAIVDAAFVADPRKNGWVVAPPLVGAGVAEADEIRDAAARVLSGQSLNSIVRDWNARGIVTPTGKQWRSPNLGKLLRGPHLAGYRVHHGATVAATWPAVFDADTHESLKRFLGDPERVVSGFTGVRKYALTNICRCAVCGGPITGKTTRLKSGPAYFCRDGQHTQAPVARVDEIVRALVVERLATVDASGVFVAPVDADRANARAAERLALDGNRKATVRDVLLAPADRAGALAAIDARIAELDAEAAADDDAARLPLRVLEGLTGVPADVVGERFDALPFDRQRAVVAVLGTPYLGRASRKGVGLPFEPERVTIRWADGPA